MAAIAEPDNQVVFEIPNLIRVYKDDKVQRFDHVVPPSLETVTGVTSKDVVIDPATGLSARLFLPANSDNSKLKLLPVLVYYHGGACCIASADNPMYPIPAAYDDSWQALQWVLASGDEWLAERGNLERVFVAGDSAGANIAHHMALRAEEIGVMLERNVDGASILLGGAARGNGPAGIAVSQMEGRILVSCKREMGR